MSSPGYFNIGIASIFAREVLEGSIIIINYRTIIRKSSVWEGEAEKVALRTVTRWSIYAALVAVLCILIFALTVRFVTKKLNDNIGFIIEGISKIVAAVCVLQISLKVPTWLGVYPKKHGNLDDNFEVGITLAEIKFNVSWNLWREVAECGVFLLPFFFLDGGAIAIPISAVVGVLISLILAFGTNYASNKLKNKFWLVFFLSTLTAALALGLFVGGCHLLEVVFGSTSTVWTLKGSFWSDKRFPMTMLKPFGYSSSRTVLQICTFWIWIFITFSFHYRKYRISMSRLDTIKNATVKDELDDASDLSQRQVESGENLNSTSINDDGDAVA